MKLKYRTKIDMAQILLRKSNGFLLLLLTINKKFKQKSTCRYENLNKQNPDTIFILPKITISKLFFWK